ncbi:uncharacterized protein Bfra_011173 [Botrytis fragariae]|uniref:Uncharacterized protein n=1 Tax=Botrytis fragariae TaxID=1964551 RepID=A0A8H6AKW9_9HELO|nr:uncharacterized protein Bfra_011173 [Botrytis fragariae]KAF5869367.1 hypothetical protein Bfra_011173 [Botrytis fragariae]
MTKHHIEQRNSEIKDSTEQPNFQMENSDSITLQPTISSDNAQNNEFNSSNKRRGIEYSTLFISNEDTGTKAGARSFEE